MAPRCHAGSIQISAGDSAVDNGVRRPFRLLGNFVRRLLRGEKTKPDARPTTDKPMSHDPGGFDGNGGAGAY
jgi:hypothetical protein